MKYVRAVREARKPELLRRDEHELANIALIIRLFTRPDSNCIDIGANLGNVIRPIMNACPAGNHIAFEPLPELAAGLRSQFPDLDVRQLALSDKVGRSEFVHVTDMNGYSGLLEQPYPRPFRTERITVDMDTLDACLPDGYRPAFIKVDVEGAEYNVIKGGLRTLLEARPLLVFEFFGASAAAFGVMPADIYSLIVDGAEMDILDIDGFGPYSLAGMSEAVESERIYNWIGRPR